MTDLNDAGRAYARSLISAGKVDKTSSWDFTAADADALLGAGGDDWSDYAKAYLGVDGSASDNTKARWKYPFAKGGKLYRSALIAIRQRAGQQGDSDILGAAGALLSQLDGDGANKSSATGFECKFATFEFKFAEENGTAPGRFDGYGSVFGNRDDNDDVMMPAAFNSTLAQAKASGRYPKMLLNHGGLAPGMLPTPTDLLPIGKWKDLTPDTTGLATKGQLINLDTESGKRIYGAMKEGELADLSIGYTARDVTRGTKSGDPRRKLNAVDLHEVSLVTFPANDRANVTAVKAMDFSHYDMRDLEAALRDGGLSRADAKSGVAVFKAYLQRDAGDPDMALRDAATSDELLARAARFRASLA